MTTATILMNVVLALAVTVFVGAMMLVCPNCDRVSFRRREQAPEQPTHIAEERGYSERQAA